jgi:tetratricopeptide (TPR) repeat protein
MKPVRSLYLAGASALAIVVAMAGAPARAAAPEAGSHAESLAGNYLAARHAGLNRDTLSAAEYYGRALLDDPRNPLLIERSLLLEIQNGAFDEAAHLAQDLLELRSGNRIARFMLAIEAMRQGDLEAAREHAAQAQSGTLADLTSGIIEGWALMGLGRVDEALDRLGRLKGPAWYELFKDFQRGVIADAAGRTEDAATFLRAAYEAESGTRRIAEAMARNMARRGEREEALGVLDAFTAGIAEQPDIADLRARIEAGEEIAPLATTPLEGVAEGLADLATALAREGGEDLGLIYLQLALYAEPEDSYGLLTLASLYEGLEKHEQAIETYEKIPSDSVFRRNADIKRALNLDAIDRSEEATQLLEVLLEADPTDLAAIQALGNIHRARQRFPEAAQAYGRAIEQIEPAERNHWTFFYYRGIANERAGDWPQAEADFKRALELYPDHPLALNYLGYSWVDRGMNLDEALDMIRRAVEQRPQDGYIVDSLGWAYYKLGRYDEAVEELERAVELRPGDATINDHLGDAYWQVGRRTEARFQWAHARDLDPEPEQLADIERKLKDGPGAPEHGQAEARPDPVETGTTEPETGG